MLEDRLSIEQQQEILHALFGFNFHVIGEHYVLFDDDNEFYGQKENERWDFTSLDGIFAYTAYRAKNQGYADAQKDIRKAMGLN